MRVETGAARVQLLTAGIVNIVPEGLILLISLTAAVSAFKVAQRGVLAQQLDAVESLASVDVLCTDKTGTLTEPTLRVVELVPATAIDQETLAHALALYAASAPSRNSTLQAIADAGPADVEPRRVVGQVPFSSRRRWSALDLGSERLVLGAPERFAAADPPLAEQARRKASSGRRVLTLARSAAMVQTADSEPPSPGDIQVLGLVARRAAAAERRRDGRLLRRSAGRAEGALRRRSGDRRCDRARRRRAGICTSARRRGAPVRTCGTARGGPCRTSRRSNFT
jgi:hypothetical protein